MKPNTSPENSLPLQSKEPSSNIPVTVPTEEEARAIDELFQKGSPLNTTKDVAYQPKPEYYDYHPRTEKLIVSGIEELDEKKG